jgi:hypothetical protein
MSKIEWADETCNLWDDVATVNGKAVALGERGMAIPTRCYAGEFLRQKKREPKK